MNKFYRVTMPDGSKWDVPCYVIAQNRAMYYAKRETGEDGGPEFGRVYKEEFDYTIEDNLELEDWATNNMHWNDVKRHAQMTEIGPDDVDYEDGWTNGEKQFVSY